MSKNTLKKIGVKSMHYVGDDVHLNDNFSATIESLCTLEYDNIEQLKELKNKNIETEGNIQKITIDTTIGKLNVINDKEKLGFNIINNKRNKSTKIKTVKKISNLHNQLGISKDNNVEIQIFHNLMDIQKNLSIYLNEVIYSTLPKIYDFKAADYIGSYKRDISFVEVLQSYYDINANCVKSNSIVNYFKTNNYSLDLKDLFNLDVNNFLAYGDIEQKFQNKYNKIAIFKYSNDFHKIIKELNRVYGRDQSKTVTDLINELELIKNNVNSDIKMNWQRKKLCIAKFNYWIEMMRNLDSTTKIVYITKNTFSHTFISRILSIEEKLMHSRKEFNEELIKFLKEKNINPIEDKFFELNIKLNLDKLNLIINENVEIKKEKYASELKNCSKETDKKKIKNNIKVEIKQIKLNYKYPTDSLYDVANQINKEIKIHDIFSFLSNVRQLTAHGYDVKYTSNVRDEINIAIKGISKSFWKSNFKYNRIFKELLKDEYHAFSFYEYTVNDLKKNLGISIINIRKNIINLIYNDLPEFNNDIYQDEKEKIKNSEFRNKFNTVLDFILYEYYNKDEQLINNLKIKLKSCESNDSIIDPKEEVYIKEAKSMLDKLNITEQIKVVRDNLGEKQIEKNSDEADALKELETRNYNINNNFSGLLYSFSKFLTIKSCNEMYSTIINKIESAIELLKISSNLNVNINLNDDNWKRFDYLNIDKTNTINSLETLKKELILIKSMRSKQKAKVIPDDSSIDKVYNMFKSNNVLLSDVKSSFDEYNEAVKNKKDVHSIAMFLKNNVMKSNKYLYVNTYASTKLANNICSNKSIVDFVINREPKLYLMRIYNELFNTKECTEDNFSDFHKNKLSEEIVSFTLDKLKDSIDKKIEENYTVILNLYLNISYLTIKNIVRQNAKYYIAIGDMEVLQNIYSATKNKPNSLMMKILNISYDSNTRTYSMLNDSNKSSKQINALLKKEYIKNYFKDDSYFIAFRNCVMHLNVLDNAKVFDEEMDVTSYFALYQILLQRYLVNNFKFNVSRIFNEPNKQITNTMISSSKTYNQKLLNALNSPFIYNMSRYNRLTIEKYNKDDL